MAKGDYDVGYGKPPKAHRFKPGQSGNPKGRPRGSNGLRRDLDQQLSSRLTIKIAGKPVKGTTQQLMLKTLATRAASGDTRAAGLLLHLILQVFGIEDRGRGPARLSAQDQALLEQLLGEQGAPNDAGAEVSTEVRDPANGKGKDNG